jgi:hypothetical protein
MISGTKLTLQIFLSVATCQKPLLENQTEIWLTGINDSILSTDEGTNWSTLVWKQNNINHSTLTQNLQKQTLMKRCTEISEVKSIIDCPSVHPLHSL